MRPVVDGNKIHLPTGMTTQQAIDGVTRMLGSYKSSNLVFEEVWSNRAAGVDADEGGLTQQPTGLLRLAFNGCAWRQGLGDAVFSLGSRAKACKAVSAAKASTLLLSYSSFSLFRLRLSSTLDRRVKPW